MMTSLYIHIPCCARKCLYCAFPVVTGRFFREADYLDAVELEAQPYRQQAVSSLYVGGGTPSLLSTDGIRRLAALVRENFIGGDAERVFEMNPESVTPEKAALLRSLGFNRVSFGAQSFDRRYLSWLGRTHGVAENFYAFKVLRSAGFDNISVDLMFGFPGQTTAQLDQDMDALVSLGSEHVAVYALTVEERSVFHVRGEKVSLDSQAELYQQVCARLKAAGLFQYEVSNFARSGFESRHNSHYWQGGNYVGLGMGAHAHHDGQRSWNADTLPQYLKMIRTGGRAVIGQEHLTPVARLMETLVLGLRMNAGINIALLEERFGVLLPVDRREELDVLVADGWLIRDGACMQVADRGRLVLDEISARLI